MESHNWFLWSLHYTNIYYDCYTPAKTLSIRNKCRYIISMESEEEQRVRGGEGEGLGNLGMEHRELCGKINSAKVNIAVKKPSTYAISRADLSIRSCGTLIGGNLRHRNTLLREADAAISTSCSVFNKTRTLYVRISIRLSGEGPACTPHSRKITWHCLYHEYCMYLHTSLPMVNVRVVTGKLRKRKSPDMHCNCPQKTLL